MFEEAQTVFAAVCGWVLQSFGVIHVFFYWRLTKCVINGKGSSDYGAASMPRTFFGVTAKAIAKAIGVRMGVEF